MLYCLHNANRQIYIIITKELKKMQSYRRATAFMKTNLKKKHTTNMQTVCHRFSWPLQKNPKALLSNFTCLASVIIRHSEKKQSKKYKNIIKKSCKDTMNYKNKDYDITDL